MARCGLPSRQVVLVRIGMRFKRAAVLDRWDEVLVEEVCLMHETAAATRDTTSALNVINGSRPTSFVACVSHDIDTPK